MTSSVEQHPAADALYFATSNSLGSNNLEKRERKLILILLNEFFYFLILVFMTQPAEVGCSTLAPGGNRRIQFSNFEF